MQNIGTNETSSTAGAWTPTPVTATSSPRVAASEYAGAVEATPIAALETKPIAPARSPGATVAGGFATVAEGGPPGGGGGAGRVDRVDAMRLSSGLEPIWETHIVVLWADCNYFDCNYFRCHVS